MIEMLRVALSSQVMFEYEVVYEFEYEVVYEFDYEVN
jgi:hypothetical protein